MPETKYEPIDWISAVDIDEYDDFKMAELCYKLKKR